MGKDGISEYAKDSMFPIMGAFSGFLFHTSLPYVENPILTIVMVYLAIFTCWTIIRTVALIIAKRIEKLKIKLYLIEVLKNKVNMN